MLRKKKPNPNSKPVDITPNATPKPSEPTPDSKPVSVDADQAQQILQEEKRQRSHACMGEIQQVLAKYRCIPGWATEHHQGGHPVGGLMIIPQ